METHAENVVYSLFLRSAKLTELMLGHSWTAESTQAGGPLRRAGDASVRKTAREGRLLTTFFCHSGTRAGGRHMPTLGNRNGHFKLK